MDKGTLTNSKGVSLVLLALSIVVLFGFAAVAIDIGHLYNVKNQLQVAADAAALAGADALFDNTDLKQVAAKRKAQEMAVRNFADVAYDEISQANLNIPGGGSLNFPGAQPGEPIPVALAGADIEVGYWDPESNDFYPATTPVNAVRVTARRTGATAQPMPQNFFARIFGLLGANLAFAGVEATAIASTAWREGGGDLLPIAVNEYWKEDSSNNPGEPYEQVYPQSFVRMTNVDGSLSSMVRNTFAIMGAAAEDNVPEGGGAPGSSNVNGFCYLDYRCDNHFGDTVPGLPTNWYDVTKSSDGCSGFCMSPASIGPPSEGQVSNRQGAFRKYLHMGYDKVPPSVIDEGLRTGSPGIDYPQTGSQNDIYSCPSDCSYATVPFFPSSGNETEQQYGDKKFWERFQAGDRIVTMVYDGTFVPDSSTAKTVSVVGYSIIEVDGYANPEPKVLTLTNIPNKDPGFEPDYSANRTELLNGSGKGTLYGHVIPHGIASAYDPYIIQFKDVDDGTGHVDMCLLMSMIEQLKDKAGQTRVRLVGYKEKYGMTRHY